MHTNGPALREIAIEILYQPQHRQALLAPLTSTQRTWTLRKVHQMENAASSEPARKGN